MNDLNHCPICFNKLRSYKVEKRYLGYLKKRALYVEKLCAGVNHSLQIFVDSDSKKIDLLKMSLTPKYSRYIEVDFYNQRCRLLLLSKNNKTEYIEIPKILELDFPELIKTKEKIDTYVMFS